MVAGVLRWELNSEAEERPVESIDGPATQGIVKEEPCSDKPEGEVKVTEEDGSEGESKGD